MDYSCAKCEKPGATKRCGRCKVNHYCSASCQQSDWKDHKITCSAPDVTSAMAETAVKPYCANCYAENPTKKCIRCKRNYCSIDCQREDWKKKGHKHYCGRSGELGTDFEIRNSPGKGLGVFALRDFKAREIIMVEKPAFKLADVPGMGADTMAQFLVSKLDSLPDSVGAAVHKLHPPGGTLSEKLCTNVFGGTANSFDKDTKLMITMSRLNHSCVGSTALRTDKLREIEQVRANRDIAAGEELTFCYLGEAAGRKVRQSRLYQQFRFSCKCIACTDPEIDRKLARVGSLMEDLRKYGARRNFSKVIKTAEGLLEAYDGLEGHLDKGAYHYPRLCDLFQAMMFLEKPLSDCQEVARQANAIAELWLDEWETQLGESRRPAADPEEAFQEKRLKTLLRTSGQGHLAHLF